MMKWAFVVVLVTVLVNCDAKSASRLPNSPYPVSQIPTHLFVVDDVQFTPEQQLVVEALQGILAQSQPQIFRTPSGEKGSALWLSLIKKFNYSTIDSTYLHDFNGLVTHFKSQVKGYLLYDSGSLTVAISVSGVTQLLPITTALQPFFDSIGLKNLQDVRGKDTKWFFNTYNNAISNKIVTFQSPTKSSCLADYSIFAKSISFFEDNPSSLTDDIFKSMHTDAALFGWGNSEFGLVKLSSSYSIMVHASDWAINLATLSNYEHQTHQKTHSTANVEQNVHTVTFLFTDGDNIQWQLRDFATGPNWYGSPHRGRMNFGWTVSPALSELAPTVLDYFYQNASNTDTAKDYFVAAPSGLGYTYPNFYAALPDFANITSEFMRKADLNILNIIGEDDNPKYLEPFLRYDNIDSIFYYDYSNYAGLKGKIFWVNNKPVIGGRYFFMQNVETAQSLAKKLNSLSTDITSPDAYSLIPVHVWTRTVDDVLECKSLLDSHVRVVTPEQFVQLINKNVHH